MQNYLCLSVLFLDPLPTFHGRCDANEPEWPPSPMRMFQALVAAAGSQPSEPQLCRSFKVVLEWLEKCAAPIVVAPPCKVGLPARIAVPNNDLDIPAGWWSKGEEPPKMQRPIDLKTMKTVRPTWILYENDKPPFVHYLYVLPEKSCVNIEPIDSVARSITHLGWGIDMVTAHASIIDSNIASDLTGERWYPAARGPSRLRVPCNGTLNGLIRKHEAFLNRIGPDGFNPVSPLSEFSVVAYQSSSESIARPFVVFELLNDDDSRFSYDQDKLIHLAGMIRHLAIESMKKSPPENVPEDWAETYVAGHAKPGAPEHRQFSYLPLPSIGHVHTDPAVRRVMIAAPIGDDKLLNHLAQYLTGRSLKPTAQTKLPHPPTLVKISGDKVTACYTKPSNTWATVTPVILPGHDDHKPAKTIKLIEKALLQSGIEQPCTFTWGALPNFRNTLTAHKYDRHKRPIGYFRPDHLQHQTAIHLRLSFQTPIPGPLAIGAGRHCGLGLLAIPPS